MKLASPEGSLLDYPDVQDFECKECGRKYTRKEVETIPWMKWQMMCIAELEEGSCDGDIVPSI